MKVLHINSYYSGGTFYKNLYDEQIKNGIEIDVFVPVSSAYKKSNFEYGSYTKVSVNHSKYDRYLFHLKHFKIYKDIVCKYNINNYNLIHAHSLFSNGYIAMNLKRNFGIPYIVAVRNTDINVFFKYMIHLRGLGLKILKNANKIIFLSESYRRNLIEKYVPIYLKEEIYNKSVIIPNGIDNFWFENKGDIKSILKGKNIKLLYVGILNKNKNVETTIKAINILQKKGYNIEFTIVGKIKNKRIYNKIKDLPYVKHISSKPKEELLEIYRTNDIFVMPSITETFGLVYAEAMSQGLPVIYSRGQGFDGQFNEGLVGFGVESKDGNEVENRILKILSTYEKQSEQCLELYGKFKWSKITENYNRLYNKTIIK